MTTYAQIFCTLAELDTDLDILGSEREMAVYAKIEAASRFLQEEIGWFIPVTLARTRQGSGEKQMFIPPLLSVVSIVNDTDTLTTSDYKLGPEQPHWPNGPYSWLEVLPDASNLFTWSSDIDGVIITGKWGLYDHIKDTGANVGTGGQTDSVTSLLLTDGSKLSPGMVVKIESEQQLVTATGSPTDAGADLGAAITDAQETLITLDDASKVNIGETIRVDLEQMKVLDTNTSTNQAYVVRGWNKTLATTHANDTDVYVYRTFTVERGVNGTTAAAHNAATDIYQQMIPADVNQLCKKIAGRMLKDAKGGFAGLIGDEMTGMARYLYILPHELDEIKKNYIIHTAG